MTQDSNDIYKWKNQANSAQPPRAGIQEKKKI